MKTKVITTIMIMLFLASITIFAIPVKADPIVAINVAQNPDGSWYATADDFELGYATVTGTEEPYSLGFNTMGFSHGRIHHCDISGWWIGVYMEGSDYVTVEYNEIHDTPWAAVMLWGDGTTYNTIYYNEIWDLDRDGIVIWAAEWHLYWDDDIGYWRALPPLDARGNTIAQNRIDGTDSYNWVIAIGFVSGTPEDPINVQNNKTTGGTQGIMATGMSMYVNIHSNSIEVTHQGIVVWGEYIHVHHNKLSVTAEDYWAGINVKLYWWIIYDPSTNNFIHHNTCNNLDIVTYYDQNSPGDNKWLKNWAPGTGWSDPYYE